jgi:hypothetical protein
MPTRPVTQAIRNRTYPERADNSPMQTEEEP